jgi:hypothetical protein
MNSKEIGCQLDLSFSGQDPVVDCYRHNNEPLGPVIEW